MCESCGDDEFGIEISNVERREHIKPSRFMALDLLVTGLLLVEDVLDSFSTAVGTLVQLTGAHANYVRDQQDFVAEAGREIESLLEER